MDWKTIRNNFEANDAVAPLVALYQSSKANAVATREAVDVVVCKLLATHTLRDQYDGKRINDPAKVWTANTEAHANFISLIDRTLRARGLKPATMPDDFCPALVAEHKQTQAERALIDVTAPLADLAPDQINTAKREIRDGWIDTVCHLAAAGALTG